MPVTDLARRLAMYREDALSCTRCRDLGLLFCHPEAGPAIPILQKDATGQAGILVIGEAPNADDTFDPVRKHLTYNPDTDPTGKFMHELLVEVVGVMPENVLFTNAVLCLPARQRDRHPVKVRQLDACRPWLVRLIEEAQPEVVVTMGAKALDAVGRIERHGLSLRQSVGRLHQWFGRKLLPIYHPGLLGRISRPADAQRRDVEPLARHVRGRRAQ